MTSLKYSWPKRGPLKEGPLVEIAVFDNEEEWVGEIRAQFHSKGQETRLR